MAVSKPTLGCLAFAVALIVLLGIVLTAYSILTAAPSSALTAGLHGKWADMSNTFDRRVTATFPLGSSATALQAALTNQGFTPHDADTSSTGHHMAVRREDGFACRKAARIYWQSDSHDAVSFIQGEYGQEGCL